MRRVLLAAGSALALTVMAASCAAGGATQAATGGAGEGFTVFRVSSQSKDTMETFKRSGALDGAPYTVEWSVLATAGDKRASLQAGATDLAVSEGTVSVTLQQGGSPQPWTAETAPVAVIAAHSPRDPANFKSMVTVARTDSGIERPSDLRGKSISFKEGGNMQTQALLSVKKGGLKPTDVKLTPLNPSDALTALKTGHIDALTNSPSAVKPLVDSGAAKIILSNTDVDFPASTATVVRRADLKNEARVKVFRDFVTRIRTWNDWKGTHQAEFAQILRDVNQLAPAAAEYQSKLGVSNVVPIDDTLLTTEQRIADVLTEGGGLSRPVDVKVGFDDRFRDVVSAKS